jgi:hypothetical protein
MWYHLTVAQPFESVDEFALSFMLLILVIVFISAYVLGVTALCGDLVQWIMNTDFDTEFFENLKASLPF